MMLYKLDSRIAASIDAGNTACAAATDCNILSTNSFTLYNDDGTSFPIATLNHDSCIYAYPLVSWTNALAAVC